MKVSIEKINEAKALLGDAAAKIIADGIPLEGFTETATSICAFSPFRHETKPSFMWNKKEYYFKDFGNGKVVGILDYFIIYESKSYSEAVKALFELVGMEYSERDFEVQEEASKWICVPDEEPNDRAIVEDYLAKRCISKETLDFCSVKQAENGDIAYQFKDQDGKLITTKYRVSHKATNKDFMKWRWKKGFTNPPLLYGLDKIDITRPVLITEGLNDRLACVEAGFMNTVSIPGGAADMSWVDTNYEFLEKLESIIIWSDSDEPGRKMAKNCAMRLGQYRVKIVEPNPDIQEEIRKYYAQYGADEDKIDANNVLIACGKDAVLAMIASAKITDNPFVSRLMDAEEKDIMSLPRTPTGIQEIDNTFWGTFEGQLVILTGAAGCVDCDTEYFNGVEWKKISEYKVGDSVLQYNKDGTATLVKPSVYHKYPSEYLWHFKTQYGIDQCLSEEHNVYYKSSRTNSLCSMKFKELMDRHNKSKNGFAGKFITSFNYNGKGIDLTDEQIELMCAVICDGSFYYHITNPKAKSYNQCRFHIKKQRKKDKLRDIFKRCALTWREKESANEGYTDFYVIVPRREKEFGDYWYNCSNRQLKIIADNIMFWDGYVTEKSHIFSSVSKKNADFVQFAFNSTGKRATITTRDRTGQKYKDCDYIRKSIEYEISIANMTTSTLSSHPKTKAKMEKYKTIDGFKYCFTVDSGMWIMRRNGRIAVTGNSGKSSLINTMFVAGPLEAGEKVFIYSGEINPGMLLGNVLKPLASRRHILEFHNENAPNGYSVSKESVKAMKKFYYDSVFVYNEENDFDTNSKSIMDAMSYAYKRYGVTNFVVDSLLTVDCSKEEGESKYDKEANFVKKLKVFTNRNPVKVCLVVHSRKLPQGATEIGADDIQGSSTHVKACNRAFSVNRLYNDPEGYDVVLTCLKDRETGLLNKKVKLHYDNKSFRLYSNDEERDKAYSWEKCSKINYPDNVAEKIVANIHEEEPVPTGIFG